MLRGNLYIAPCYCLLMSQNIEEMLAAWEKSCAEKSVVELPTRFYDVRKRATPRKIHSTGGMTPEGEALRAAELGLDKKCADPLPEPKAAWVPTGEPGSYEGRRESQQPLGNDADLWE